MPANLDNVIVCNAHGGGCGLSATHVCIEPSGAAPRCYNHAEERKHQRGPAAQIVTIEEWVTKLCPQNRPHDPHPGCWRGRSIQRTGTDWWR